jgi:hypothetical protein
MNTIRSYLMECTIHTFYLIIVLFWFITVRVVVVSYRRCGTTYWPHVQGALNMGPMLSRNFGKELQLHSA